MKLKRSNYTHLTQIIEQNESTQPYSAQYAILFDVSCIDLIRIAQKHPKVFLFNFITDADTMDDYNDIRVYSHIHVPIFIGKQKDREKIAEQYVELQFGHYYKNARRIELKDIEK